MQLLLLPLAIAAGILKIITYHLSPVTYFDIAWRQVLRCSITKSIVKKHASKFLKEYKKYRFGWAAEQVAKEKAAGNFVILTSAGPDYLILPLVKDMKFDIVIASVMDSEKPWKYEFFNWNKNKVMAIQSLLDAGAKVVRAYSDSKTDVPMMSIAKEQVWIDPKTGLRK